MDQNKFVIRNSDKASDPIHYTVTFSTDNVYCSCPAMAELIRKGKTSTKANNNVCKHVALIVLKTDKSWWSFYHGKRNFSWSEGEDISNMLNHFNPQKVIPENDYKREKIEQTEQKKVAIFHPINKCLSLIHI